MAIETAEIHGAAGWDWEGYPIDGGGEVVGMLLERVEVPEQRAEMLFSMFPHRSPASPLLACCYAYAPPPSVADDRDKQERWSQMSDR